MESSNKILEVKKRRRYDAEFKQNALELIADGRSVNSVSESLGVSANLLYTWRSQSKRKDSVTTKEKQEQIKHLQREVKELERELVYMAIRMHQIRSSLEILPIYPAS